jgi:hypothetical protein
MLDPHLTKDLIERDDPISAKSKTEQEDPNLAIPYKDMLLPMRTKLLIDILEPIVMKSRIDI